tara:strand:- start:475 stop:1065 length:591 start_codon:yes stop_codon:yes gene_type:complete
MKRNSVDPIDRKPATTSEALLAALARGGDSGAFTELMRRRQSWIRNLMRRATGDAVLADDLAQQTFLQAWRKIGGLREPGRFGAWLKQLAINVVRQHLRTKDALRSAAPEEEINAAAAPAPPAGTAMDLDRMLATLSAPMRLCIVLAYHEGMTHGEIAEATGLPTGTVKSHIRRGTERLRHLLSDYRETRTLEDFE